MTATPTVETLVVKVGTSTLTAGTSHLNRRRMLEIAQQIVCAREQGVRVVLVSSGAMAAGRERLGMTDRNPASQSKTLPEKQMLAAVGQTHLMALWEQVFGMFDVRVAQVLLTRADLSDRRRYLNARDTLLTILDHNILPIVNENDAVTTEEIRVGDNDNLSALVTNVLDADLLLILSDIDGLFTADPRKDKNAKLIGEVREIDDRIRALAGGSKTGLGVGGMSTKIQAAELVTRAGASMVVAHGARPNVILDAVRGQPVGTRFLPVVTQIESRKRWILSERTSGAFVADDGAVRALRSGKSLLPVGVKEVVGEFERGEFVAVRDAQGREVARGITRYSARDASRIAGKRSDQIEKILGYNYAPMLIHADDLVTL
ncbi:MAG: glutamate 5-kinase [Anaerolineae bacterium]|nr:glutamate 5-kinase [Candidatus Roseilinea sp.]MDW8451148.1 glutamate 5-kinase [Anaerolineae bacterium]